MTFEILKPEDPNNQSTPDTLLNERQMRFCEAYIRQPVGRYAAMEAGYAPKGAAVQASRLLEQPAIRARIDTLRADIATRNCDHVDAILSKLEAIYEGALSSHQFHAAVRAVELQVRLSRIMRAEDAAPGPDEIPANVNPNLSMLTPQGRLG
jgi:phage terminase small subunit